jgi:pimeloyl-ACP methyl ester carboxylesterase
MILSQEPVSTFVTVDGRRLHVTMRGDPAAPPIVLVHGMRDHARSWDWVASALADHFYVLAPDLRGHGDSDHAGSCSYGMAAFVLDLACVVIALDLARFGLVGHSLGGAIALRFASAFPERVRALCGIEAIEPPIVRDQRVAPQAFPRRLRNWIDEERARSNRLAKSYGSIAEAAQRMAQAHPKLDHETVIHLTKHGLTAMPGNRWQWKHDNAARLRAPEDAEGRDLDELLAAIACPALLAYGETSWIAPPPKPRLDLIQNHRLVLFPGVGHWLHHEARTDFLTTLTIFLKKN